MIRPVIFFFSFILHLVFYAQDVGNPSVKLFFIGDIMGHGPQIKAAYNSQTGTYQYDSNFQYVHSLFSEADFVIGNLEVTLGTKPYTGYPQFSSPVALAKAAKNSGINVLCTANNHSCDRRKKGILKTIAVLDSLAIKHTGTFVNKVEKERQTPLILEQHSIRIAVLNYTYGTNGIPVPAGTVVNILDKKNVLQDIVKAKSSGVDAIIAFVHWGQQYKDLPVAFQKKWFQFFKEQGVNIVIGSHPHVVEPMEWNKQEPSLVVYSLGNFISNQRTFPRDGAVIFELELTKESGKTRITKARYMATWVYKAIYQNAVDYQVLPIDVFQYYPGFFNRHADYEQMMRYYKYQQKLLQKNNLQVDEYMFFTEALQQIFTSLYF